MALVDPAGTEVLGSLANLHWILLAASVVISVCMWLGNPPGWTGNTVLVLTTLSSPLGPVLLVPMGLVAVVKRSPGARRTTIVVGCAALIQALAMVNSERPAPSGPSPTLADLVSWTGVAVRDWGWFGSAIPNANLLMAAGMVAVLGLLVVRRRFWVATVAASLTVVGLAVLAASAGLNHAVTPRHAYVLITLMLCGSAIGLGSLAEELRRPLRSVVMVIIVAIVGLGFAMSFRVESGSSARARRDGTARCGRLPCRHVSPGRDLASRLADVDTVSRVLIALNGAGTIDQGRDSHPAQSQSSRGGAS